jgi:membrane fusion protein (multidrug efflux system)
VVGERKVSAGDTAAIGKELFKVMDPTSMRFAGRVSADKISVVSVGQAVSFRINGYAGQDFRGKVTRVNPSANDITRQVEVLVSFVRCQPSQRCRVCMPKVRDRVGQGSRRSRLPETALVQVRATSRRSGAIKDLNALNQSGAECWVRVTRALAILRCAPAWPTGDTVMRNPSSNFKEGQLVEMVTVKPAVVGLRNPCCVRPKGNKHVSL